jgi:PAS domain S-box-containing protein
LLEPGNGTHPPLLIIRALPKEHAAARFLVLNEKLDALAKEVLRRTRAEELSQQSEQRLRFAYEAANLGSWEWNLDTNEVWWSDEICTIHGYVGIKSSYTAWMSFVVPEDRERVQQSVLEALGGAKFDVEYRSEGPDNSLRWIATRGKVLRDSEGRPVRMAGIAIDITRRKLAEESLRRTEKLATAGRMAATIAHEVNNPLTGVVNLLYLLRGNPSLDERAMEMLTLAEHELARVTHITKQTLGFYRDNAAPISLDLGQAIRDIISFYQHKFDAKNIKPEIECPRKVEITALSGEIRQVLSNLVVNAVDAMNAGGKLRVKVRSSRAWKDGTLCGVHVTIADTGCGITPEQMKRLFEAFYTTKKDVGTGLGLFVSKQIIEKHGGTIKVRSSTKPVRCGTVFSIFLPYFQVVAADAARLTATISGSGQ